MIHEADEFQHNAKFFRTSDHSYLYYFRTSSHFFVAELTFTEEVDFQDKKSIEALLETSEISASISYAMSQRHAVTIVLALADESGRIVGDICLSFRPGDFLKNKKVSKIVSHAASLESISTPS